MCPLRAEISTHKHLGKCIYLLFVWLAVIGFRQNYFYILPNFLHFGVKMSFIYNKINQKRNNFIKHCPPVYQEAADIRDVYLYKSSLCKWGLGTRGGERCSIDKKWKGCRLTTYKIRWKWNDEKANGKLRKSSTFR